MACAVIEKPGFLRRAHVRSPSIPRNQPPEAGFFTQPRRDRPLETIRCFLPVVSVAGALSPDGRAREPSSVPPLRVFGVVRFDVESRFAEGEHHRSLG